MTQIRSDHAEHIGQMRSEHAALQLQMEMIMTKLGLGSSIASTSTSPALDPSVPDEDTC